MKEGGFLFVLMKEPGTGEHYLNYAIPTDDYVCGFANCTLGFIPSW